MFASLQESKVDLDSMNGYSETPTPVAVVAPAVAQGAMHTRTVHLTGELENRLFFVDPLSQRVRS